MPPNAVIVGVIESDGSQYLGRVGVGKSKHFCCSWLGEEKHVVNSRILCRLYISKNPTINDIVSFVGYVNVVHSNF